MNWYKTSRLADKKSPKDNMSIFTQCAYCHYWAAEDESGDVTWKERLDKEEENEKLSGHISHGMCPDCYGVMEEQGVLTSPEDIASLSLKRKNQSPSRI